MQFKEIVKLSKRFCACAIEIYSIFFPIYVQPYPMPALFDVMWVRVSNYDNGEIWTVVDVKRVICDDVIEQLGFVFLQNSFDLKVR